MARGHDRGPRAGSLAHFALSKLHGIGGKATLEEWMRAVVYSGTIRVFQRDVVDRLTRLKVVDYIAPSFSITDNGLDALGIAVDAAPLDPPVLVGAHYTIPPRPLNTAKHLSWRANARPGSLGYLDIPSMMGGERVPYKSSLETGDDL